MLLLQIVQVPVDTHIPVWQIVVGAILGVGGFIGAWKLSLYRINELRKDLDSMDALVRVLAQSCATMNQRIEDHAKVDDDRFDRVELMFKEIRDDLRIMRGHVSPRR